MEEHPLNSELNLIIYSFVFTFNSMLFCLLFVLNIVLEFIRRAVYSYRLRLDELEFFTAVCTHQ